MGRVPAPSCLTNSCSQYARHSAAHDCLSRSKGVDTRCLRNKGLLVVAASRSQTRHMGSLLVNRPVAARSAGGGRGPAANEAGGQQCTQQNRSEEHTAELQSRENLVCRLLLEKNKVMTTQEENVTSGQ